MELEARNNAWKTLLINNKYQEHFAASAR